MEEGTKTKKTVFVGGLSDDVDQAVLIESFSPFGDVIDVQLPLAPATRGQESEGKHRGFAFVTYSSAGDAQDAIDNMDLNELRGKVLKVNLARPQRGVAQLNNSRPIWESEDWLKQYAKPLGQSGGLQARGSSTPDPEAADDAGGDEAGDAMED
ncbi:RNA-binding domain-containing protein [Auriscalpium vulgare]|uniref:RNA-binding domain-containing protein n=1 Tax=Auriscalpium vulgare TaxID=40419 RepID=A0ACB8SD64_9AGAM|nr:RNA-binding domain-containing protein [Auriscalpium vulgare]